MDEPRRPRRVAVAEPPSAPAIAAIENPFTTRVFDPGAFAAALGEDDDFLGPEDERPFGALARPSEEEARARVLRRAMGDPHGGERRLLHADGGTLAALRAATATAPHFAAVTGIVARAVATAVATGMPIRFPPILMVSEPGLGKTHYAKAVAGALGTRVVPIAMNATSDRGQLGGSSTAWRGAKTGRLAKAAVFECETASPLFLLDELDKATCLHGENVASILLSAMEPENAKAFVDEYLDVPVRLDAALWLASANDLTTIAAPLLSRMLVVEVPMPTAEQARVVVRAIAAAASPLPLSDDGIDLLLDLVPRQARQTIELAHPFAVCARRGVIGADDVRAALALSNRPVSRAIGFVSGASR